MRACVCWMRVRVRVRAACVLVCACACACVFCAFILFAIDSFTHQTCVERNCTLITLAFDQNCLVRANLRVIFSLRRRYSTTHSCTQHTRTYTTFSLSRTRTHTHAPIRILSLSLSLTCSMHIRKHRALPKLQGEKSSLRRRYISYAQSVTHESVQICTHAYPQHAYTQTHTHTHTSHWLNSYGDMITIHTHTPALTHKYTQICSSLHSLVFLLKKRFLAGCLVL